MTAKERRRLFDHILRLRHAERLAPDLKLEPVREDLEQQLGETVSRNLAAQILGVSHTALERWIDRGDVPLVITPAGRKEVPVSALIVLREQLDEQDRGRPRRLHRLEPVMREARTKAKRMRPGRVKSGEPGAEDRHRTSELRGLAYHRALARRLRRPMIDEASRRLRRWEREEAIDPRHAAAWREVLSRPVPEVAKLISADTPAGRDLRQNSPFAGMLSEAERRRVLDKVR